MIDNKYIPLSLIGISHKTAPVDIREKVALDADRQKLLLPSLIGQYAIDGCMIVSTCNRTELYLSGEESRSILPQIRLYLDREKNCNYFSDQNFTYTFYDLDTVKHFFRVVSGLDSQILGEPQITGQVKDAYLTAQNLRTTDTVLNKLYNFALQAEKSIRSDTFLTDGAVSVSYAGVELARKIFSDLAEKRVLMIGAGETAELALTHFMERGVSQISIVNRTVNKAEELAARFNGRAFGLDQLDAAFKNADIVISATSSPQPVVTFEFIRNLMRNRRHAPLLLIDLAMPRDIEPAIQKLDDVFLYNLDDLNEVVQANLEKRRAEIPKCEKIIDTYAMDFFRWFSSHSVGATIHRLQKFFDKLRHDELDRLRKRLPPDKFSEIDYLTQSIVNKIMHKHIKAMKKSAGNPDLYQQRIDFINELYDLDHED